MKNYPRHRATSPHFIMKDDYNEIIKSAKRKHKDEFYIFKINYFGDISYEEHAGGFPYTDYFQHWKKINGKWVLSHERG